VVNGCGIHCGGIWNTPRSGLNDVDSIQKNGSSMVKAPAVTTMYEIVLKMMRFSRCPT